MAEARSRERDRAGDDAWDEMGVIRRAAEGDHDAFAVLVQAYERGLLAYLTQMLGDPEQARDLAQEAFLSAYQALPRWRAPEVHQGSESMATPRLLAPWLYRIATNRALSHLRTQPRAAQPQSLDIEDHKRVSSHSGMASLEERTIARDLLLRALRTLSDEDAACLVLHFVLGERYGEIGERLGLTAEAVRKRVTRGLVALRAAYADLESEASR